MKALSLAAVMTAICSTASFGQFTPECNQMRELYRQYNEYMTRNPFNPEENGILKRCATLAAVTSLNGTRSFNSDVSGCFFTGCNIGTTTSQCTRKSTVLEDSLNLTDRMKSTLCPEPNLGAN